MDLVDSLILHCLSPIVGKKTKTIYVIQIQRVQANVTQRMINSGIMQFLGEGVLWHAAAAVDNIIVITISS